MTVDAESKSAAGSRSGLGTGVERVFIIGYPRSGTTWLMWLLAQHPTVAAVRQSGIFHQLRPLRAWWRRDHEFTSGARRSAEGEDSGSNYELLNTRDFLSPDDFYDAVRPFCDAVYDRILHQTPGARVVVEQTPENARQADIVQGVYPDARFLHVVRDPRAVFASMKSASRSWSGPRGFPRHPVPIARIWTEFVQRGRTLAEDPRRCFEVRYEDLIADGPARLLEIHRWLGLETDPASCERAIEACRLDKLRSKTTSPQGFFRRGQAAGWQDEVSRSEQRVIEHLAGEAMAHWDYERSEPEGMGEPLPVRLYDLADRAVNWAGRTRWLAWARNLWARASRSLEIMTHTKGGPPPD